MLAIKVTGGVLLALLLLLLAPLRLRFSYREGEMSAFLYYLFLRFRVLPMKERTEKEKKEPEKAAEKTKKPDKPPEKKKDAGMQMRQIGEMLRKTKKGARILCRNLVIYKVEADIKIAREDAHKTALAYAMTSSFLVALTGVLDRAFVLKKPRIRLSPDFAGEKSRYNISLRLRIRPACILAAAIYILVAFLRVSRSKSK